MKPRIVFVVMSAIHSADTVADLARSLAPHTVLVHHDFAQTPKFKVNEPNVIFVPEPKRTGWGVWGFTQGVFHALQFAVATLEFDYLQLLSPTCLPIKPLSALEAHVATGSTEADFSCVDLLAERDGLMSVSWRAFAPEHTFRHRLLRRLSRTYYGSSPDRLDIAGIQLLTAPRRARGLPRWRALMALAVTRALTHVSISRHVFDENLRPYFGSVWFGAHRPVIEWMINRFREPDIQRYFPGLRLPEELVIPTILGNSGFKSGPYNHCIITFNDANPKWLDEGDFDLLRRSPAFFARKFPVETASPIRRRVLDELVGLGGDGQAETLRSAAPAKAGSLLSSGAQVVGAG
jgi:hypothetical protein